jgi:hypothetical protein
MFGDFTDIYICHNSRIFSFIKTESPLIQSFLFVRHVEDLPTGGWADSKPTQKQPFLGGLSGYA